MTDSALQAQIDAATAYEEFFVPAMFQEWAPRVVAAAHVQPGQRVLDVACGTGGYKYRGHKYRKYRGQV